MSDIDRTALWDAIAELVIACGGSTADFREDIADKIDAIVRPIPAPTPATPGEQESVLDLLRGARVFEIEKTEGCQFEFTERCDDWFGVTLTREQMLRLADEIRALAG